VPFSEWLDWNQPPLFKSLLRVDAEPGEVRIRCFAATGCRDQEQAPPVEDQRAPRSATMVAGAGTRSARIEDVA
jgi:hypothetical protein